jgi:hypothetical protein
MATATAVINFDTGEVTDIILTSQGAGYTSTPLVTINGSATTTASAYAILKNNKVRTFDTTLKFDRISYGSTVVDWTANTFFTANTIVSHATLEGNTYIRHAYKVNSNITTGNTFVTSDYTLFASNAFTNANDRIIGYYQPNSNMPARDLKQLLFGVDYPGAQVQGTTFGSTPLYDGLFDYGHYDNVDYDEDGNPILTEQVVDTIIRSTYTDSSLGIRPEDIDVVGGAYVDRYSSHAPEEMVPGIVFDTLDMKVYTKINGNADVVGYRILNRNYQMFGNAAVGSSVNETTYLRIADANTTKLVLPLLITDTEIFVEDASKLPTPNPTDAVPGVVFINAERITYYTIDTVSNKLGQIRRGTKGTGAAARHGAGALVVDASQQQLIPGTTFANVTYSPAGANVTHIPTSANVRNEGNVNLWYNDGNHTFAATDGSGLQGSTTLAALFLKDSSATEAIKGTVSDELVTEDAINTITTEDGNTIIEEDQ